MGEAAGLSVWCEDEAGPYQTQPYPGGSWALDGHPIHQPHEYHRDGTAKRLTLFQPARGRVSVKGVQRTTNTIVHGWLKEQFLAILADLPAAVARPGSSWWSSRASAETRRRR